MITSQPRVIFRALTREIDNTASPVRRFLDERFTSGLKELQRGFRQAAPPVVVPSVPQAEANPGTVGGAADWLLRFLVFPHPCVHLALAGAAHLSPGMMMGMAELAEMLGVADLPGTLSMGTSPVSGSVHTFTGPVTASSVDHELLARACWALALATEAARSAQAAAMGPLARLPDKPLLVDDLLALAPPAGLDQLAGFRRVFETSLIPQLADRPGVWALGPTFAGSALIGGADADLIAAGLLLELKTSAKLSLGVKDLMQVIGYALLDFDDEYRIDTLGIFTARYGYLATWELGDLLSELAGEQVSLRDARAEFRQLLVAHRG
jgi:hypothetical protein